MADERVLLGFVQEPELPWTDFPCKAGGAPVWLDPQNLPSLDDACCGFCKEPLQFLLQVHVPDDSRHRSLFVFMCPRMACLKADQAAQKNQETSSRSVKVFRGELPLENPFYSRDCRPLTDGVRVCDWCKTWKGGNQCGSCRKTKYCSRKHQVEHWQAGHKVSCKSGAHDEGARKKLWRELEIVSDTEDEEEDDDDAANSLKIVPQKQEPEFEGFEEASKEDQFWAAFQTRIQRAPSQVLRFGSLTRESKPLWMQLDGQPEEADILPCQLCGGTRVFEFQVMSQLLYFFGVENKVDSLDWGTVAVYSCLDSCPVDGYAEEFAWVQFCPSM